MSETIGQRIKRLRLAAGLSQRQLADGCDRVTYAYLSRIEGGDRTPSVRALRQLAPKLGVSAHELEFGYPDGAYIVVVTDVERELLTAFSDESNADDLAERLTKAGYNATVEYQPIDNKLILEAILEQYGLDELDLEETG